MVGNGMKPYPELPDSDDLYVLDMFGGVSPNIDEPDNPLLECFLTPLTPREASDGKSRLQRNTSSQICISLAVGYLPSLYLGCTFKRQRRAPLEYWPDTEIATLEIDTSTLFSEKKQGELALKWPLTAHRFTKSGNRALFTTGIAKQIHTNSARSRWKNGESISVAIADIEIIRFYLSNSSFSCKQIFTGAFQNNELAHRVVNDNYEPRYFDTEARYARFIYRNGYVKEDALSLGRILFEPNGYALRAAQSVHNSIVRSRINSASPIGYPHTFFPFRQTIRLEVVGRRLPTNNEKDSFVFLMQKIIRCSGTFPFKDLSFYCDSAPGLGPGPEDGDAAFATNIYSDTGPAHQGADVGYSLSDMRPSKDSSTIETILDERSFDDLENITFSYQTDHPSTYRSQPRIRREIETLVNASTGAGTSGLSSSAKQTIRDRNVEGMNLAEAPEVDETVVTPLPTDLQTFEKVIENIKAARSEWSVAQLYIPDGYSSRRICSVFPMVKCEVRTDRMRQFSFMDKAQLQRRNLLCFEIIVNEHYLYLFEAERRPRDGSDEPDFKEQMPILLLHRPDYSEVLGKDFMLFLEKTVELKRWPLANELYGFRRQHTLHGLGANTVIDLAERIINLISRSLPAIETQSPAV